MRADDILLDIRARVDEIERPWAAFIGLVALRPSKYVTNGAVFALDPSGAGFAELGQFVVLHPDDIEVAREAALRGAGRAGQGMSDDELAAFLYWCAHQRRVKP